MSWRRFDIHVGVWRYTYRMGHNDRPVYDHHAGTGNGSHAWIAKHNLVLIAQAKCTTSLESRRGPSYLSDTLRTSDL